MSIFDEIKAGGEKAIHELIGRSETLDFDCKLKDTRASTRLSDNDKENLTSTLSAFCNSAGGVLLWGVDARRNPRTGCDEIIGFQPIEDVGEIAEQMKRIWTERIMPRLDDVETEVVKCADDPRKGFIVMRVARSERRPHRCEVTKKYWRRAGNASRAMEHFEIEDAFRRLTIPELEVVTHLRAEAITEPMETRSGGASVLFILSLKNVSNASARFPYLQIKSDQAVNLPGLHGMRLHDGCYHYEGGADVVIHPGMHREMGALRVVIPLRLVTTQVRPPLTAVQADMTDVRQSFLNVAFGCYHSPVTRRDIQIQLESFQNLFPKMNFL